MTPASPAPKPDRRVFALPPLEVFWQGGDPQLLKIVHDGNQTFVIPRRDALVLARALHSLDFLEHVAKAMDAALNSDIDGSMAVEAFAVEGTIPLTRGPKLPKRGS